MQSPAPHVGLGRAAPHALVIEHDAGAREALVQTLSEAGYPTLAEHNGEAGLRAALMGQPDLVVLGPALPDRDAVTLLPKLRGAVAGVVTLVVTGQGEESHLVELLDAGADDCLVKPYGGAMLLARVRAVLRRSKDQSRPRSIVRLGGLYMDLVARRARLDGAALALSPREFDLLAYLALRVGQVVSKQELLSRVWRLPYSVADKTVDVHVSWLRRKLKESAQRPRYLHTVRGVGLRLDIPQAGIPQD